MMEGVAAGQPGPPLSVMVAMPCLTDPSLHTTMSLLDTQEECLKHGIKIDFAFVSGTLVHHARTLLGNTFLGKPEFNRLFWVDSDIKWTPSDFLKVLAHTLKYDCVVGIYPSRGDPLRYYAKLVPDQEPDEDGLVRIEGTGLGFACVTRTVMERLAEKAPLRRYLNSDPVPRLFRCDDDGEEERGEDYAFWADVKALGYEIYADATITLGHVGSKVYRSSLSKN